jgi:alginate O-acetyltransferase complex protein AlgI
MLFNSYFFLFAFLPVVVLVFFLVGHASAPVARVWLVLASIVFYSWWDWHFTIILFISVCFNYGVGVLLARTPPDARQRQIVLMAAVAVDLAVLGWFKYVNFLIDSAGSLLGLPLPHYGVLLPIGISFFTFTQIAFLVDVARGRAHERGFIPYLLFVTYFPHLIAGPILHHAEMMPQFADRSIYRPRLESISVGLTVFMAGLFKKMVLADSVAPFADIAFAAAGHGTPLTLSEAWGGALAYTFQIYFDFSAYTDMAIGLSRLFNITLPINFESPYQARSIIDFWRRWHITLSRFLRDYLYVSLGGNRKGAVRRHFNLIATMLLGGLWHGAGWTFVIWGGLHGLYLIINHGFRHAVSSSGLDPKSWPPAARAMWHFAAWGLTFLAVVVAWVFFRAPDLASATIILKGMAGLNGFARPPAPIVGMRADAWLIGSFVIAMFLPNLRHIMAGHELVSLGGTTLRPSGCTSGRLAAALRWRPHPAVAVLTVAAFVVCLLRMQTVSQFLYFQF